MYILPVRPNVSLSLSFNNKDKKRISRHKNYQKYCVKKHLDINAFLDDKSPLY